MGKSNRWLFLTLLLLVGWGVVGCGAATPEPSLVVETRLPTTDASPDAVAAAPTQRAATRTPVPPTETATPLPTATARATATPVPTPYLTQLTTGGCCVAPFWRADGQAVRFIDRPTAAMPAGYYEVPIDTAAPLLMGDLVTDTLGNWLNGDRFYSIPGDGVITLIDNETGQTYQPDVGTTRVTVSPDGTRLAWQETQQDDSIPFDQRRAVLSVGNLDGSNAQVILDEKGSSFAGWLNNDTWLITVVAPGNPNERLLYRYSLNDGARLELARGARVNGTAIDADSTYIAYYISLERDHPERQGYWLTNTETGETTPLPFVGAYRWRTPTTLLVLPFEPEAPSLRFQEYDITTGVLTDITDPTILPFTIHNGDWQLSPDGNRIVFVNSADRNLWMLTLPPTASQATLP